MTPSNSNIMYMRDWRKALVSSPPTYRIGNTTLRFHIHFAFMAFCFGSLILIFLYVKPTSISSYSSVPHWSANSVLMTPYNYTYPLTVPIQSNGMHTYRIGIIADLDQNSLKPDTKNTWRSYYKKGYLSYSPAKETIAVSFDVDKPIELVHNYALRGRGMELSELVTFDGRLFTVDDRTGFVYEMSDNNKLIPWVVLMDGAGHSSKGFKSEWATVKDETLYVGSMGKEWTSASGDFESFDPMYVKAITKHGQVSVICMNGIVQTIYHDLI